MNVFFLLPGFPLSIEESAYACSNDDPDGRETQEPDEQGRYNGYPQVVAVDACRLAHAERGRGDERYDGRTDALEDAFHHGVLLEVVEKEGDGQDDEERGQDGAQCRDDASADAAQAVADEDGDVDC